MTKQEKIKELESKIKEMENQIKELKKSKKEITLGSYNKTPIEWIILEEDNNSMTLLSKYVLEMRRFDEQFLEETNEYEESEIKDFLENYMKPRIKDISIKDITLLSKNEIEKYFSIVEDRIAYLEPNKYGKDIVIKYWLRSSYVPYSSAHNYVDYNGTIHYCNVDNSGIGVRPVIMINKGK